MRAACKERCDERRYSIYAMRRVAEKEYKRARGARKRAYARRRYMRQERDVCYMMFHTIYRKPYA